jgi:hypothetical protein
MLHRFHSGVAGSLGWVVFLCVPLAVSSRAVSQERPADAVKSAAASPSVDRILQSWKAREDRTKTVHCVWDSQEVRNGKSDRQPALVGSQSECWIGRDNQCRFQTNTERRGGPTGREKMHLSTAFDGRVFFSLNWTKPSKLPPRGKIWNFGKRHVGFLTGAMMPLDWAYRPSLRASLSPERFRLVTEDAIVNGLRCTKLRGYDKKGWSLGSFWFDPRQGDALVFWDLAGAESLTMPLSLRYQLDKSSGPVVASWTMSQDDGSNAISTVKTLEINKELPAETFQISFPPGTAVAVDDGATQEAYIVKPDGTKRAIFNLNSVSPRLRKILIQTTDFTVEPEPLRDAIDFLHNRYAIAITMDRASFKNAKIDPSLEVQSDTAGIRFWEVLAWFSAQCPRPFGIFEQNGSLLLKPL